MANTLRKKGSPPPQDDAPQTARSLAEEFKIDEPRGISQLLLDADLLGKKDFLAAEEKELRFSGDLIDPSPFIDASVLKLLPVNLIRKHHVLPLKREGEALTLAAAGPVAPDALEEIHRTSGLAPKIVIGYRKDIEHAIECCCKRTDQIEFQNMKLGEILIARSVITRRQLQEALEQQKRSGKKLGEILVRKHGVSETAIYSALAKKLGCQYRNFDRGEIDKKMARIVSQRFAETHNLVPLGLDEVNRRVEVAMSSPQDLVVVDLLRKICNLKGLDLDVVMSTPSAILRGICYLYDTYSDALEQVEMETVEPLDTGRPNLISEEDLPEIRRIVNGVLYQAVMEGASDIHIENLEHRVQVRFRIDGILQVRETPINKENIDEIISVLKIDAHMDFAEHRRPQDGGFKTRIGADWQIDFRINVHSTEFGSDAVMRVLDSTKKLPELTALGVDDDLLEEYQKLMRNPQGLILITGPTGSGKSTTLYSTLREINSTEVKIVTAEDPVEYHLDGVIQYQVNPQIGNTFAEYARRFLRKDPDIILIGETRDEITATACLRASATGHLVFSTLHTNNSIAAVRRLRDLGVDASSICDSVIAIVAQRLVRLNCRDCLEPYEPSEEIVEQFFGENKPEGFNFARGRGCENCGHTGFSGRIGVWELWRPNRAARELMMSNATELELMAAAIRSGMRPLVVGAVEKAKAGITTLEELRRVVSYDQIAFYHDWAEAALRESGAQRAYRGSGLRGLNRGNRLPAARRPKAASRT